MPKLYGITGMPLAGKTVVAEMMADQGYTKLDMGDVVRQEMEKRNIPVEKTAEFVNQQRDQHGMDAIAHLSSPYLTELLEQTDKIVITGMRGWSEKQRFEKETGEDLEIIAIWASRKTRKKRRERRKREEDVKGQSFHARDLREIENGIGKLMALSDRLIVNDKINLQQLEQRVKKTTED